MRRVLAAVAAVFLAFACAVPAAADDGYVDVRVQVFFDRPAYLPSDVVRMSVTVQNQGTSTATGVKLHSTGDMTFTGWGLYDENGDGAVMPPGYSTTVVVEATPNDPGNGMTQKVEATSIEPDQDPTNNSGVASAFVTDYVCDLTLTLHTDSDGDGVLEPGEVKSGVLITLVGGRAGGETFQTRTDDHGVASFPKITGGEYSVTAGLPADWHVNYDENVRLRAGHNEVVVRAWHMDMSKVAVSLALDRPTYQVGDPVREHVTITNNGGTDIHGLVARCGTVHIEGSGENELLSAGWGELDAESPTAGATVLAGETRTWEFAAEITPIMWNYGEVVLKCDFRVSGMPEGVYVVTRAKVPGGRGTFGGRAYLTGSQQPMPGLKILMIDPSTGAVVTRTTAGQEGVFDFPEVPAGEYQLRPVGPWRTVDKTSSVQVKAGVRGEVGLEVEPGPVVDEPSEVESVPPPVTPTPPAPQASPAPHPSALAHTGVDVAPLLAFAALLLVTGGLLTRVRRRA
jgi:hypothetical protein